jgi:hypothetical protein
MGIALGGSLFFGLYGPNTPTNEQRSANEEQSSKKETTEKSDEALARYTFWLTVFTGVLAFATITLGIATIGLYATGEKQAKIAKLANIRQFRQSRESIALTKLSADAAILNAKAAIGVKLPSIHASKIELFHPGPPYGKNADTYKSQIIDGRPPSNSQIAITFSNIGETNAHIAGICFEYFVGHRLPPLPTYQRILPFTETVIKANHEWQFCPVNFFIMLNAEQDRALDLVLASHLWVYGYISYLDFMNTPHEHRFCQRWLTTSILGSPTGFVPEFYIPREYTQNH